MKTEEHRYLFLVRQGFNETPHVDSFYKLTTPNMTVNELKMWSALGTSYDETMRADSHVFTGMELRLRFNTDMYQHICIVRSEVEINVEELDLVLELKQKENKLNEFLENAKI